MTSPGRDRLGEGTTHELRIHGVAGSSADAVLDDVGLTDPTPNACGGEPSGTQISVWRRRVQDHGVRAYSWGSVTSGSVATALYLLLLPYLLVNLAGWSALPGQHPGASSLDPGGSTRPPGVRLVAAVVRLAGLGISVIFAQWALLVTVDIVAYQWAVRRQGWSPAYMALGLLLAALLVELQRRVTRVRLRPDAEPLKTDRATTDPVGYSWVTHDQFRLWDSPGTIALQRNSHHATALGAMAWVAIAMATGWGEVPTAGLGPLVTTLAVPLSVVALVVGIGLTIAHSLAPGRSTPGFAVAATVAAPWLGRAAILLAMLVLAVVQLPEAMEAAGEAATFAEATYDGTAADLSMDVVDDLADQGQPLFLPVIRDIGVGLTIANTLWLVLAGVIAYLARERSESPDGSAFSRWAPFNVTGFLLLAGAVAAGIGAAGTLAVSGLLGGDQPGELIVPGPLPESLAISFAALLVTLGWVLVIGLVMQLKSVPADPSTATVGSGKVGVRRRRLVQLTTAVQRMLTGGSWLMAAMTAAGLVGVVLLIWLSRSANNALLVLDGLPLVPELIVITTLALVAALIALAVGYLHGTRPAVLAFLALVSGVVLAVTLLPDERVSGIIRPTATLIGLVGPASVMAGKGLSAMRNRSQRRSIAILWDVGTFFPRWFHPLSPPSYGDHVVTDLTELVEEQLARPGKTLVLSPHSQGTVIAATAVLGLAKKTDASGLALLTHGSPLRQFYSEFFPRLFCPTTMVALRDRLHGTRWINLLRTSDPVAAPIEFQDGGTVDRVLSEDPCGRNHIAYSREPMYAEAMADLRARLTDPVTNPSG